MQGDKLSTRYNESEAQDRIQYKYLYCNFNLAILRIPKSWLFLLYAEFSIDA